MGAAILALMPVSGLAQQLDGSVFLPPTMMTELAPLPPDIFNGRLALAATDICAAARTNLADATGQVTNASASECTLTDARIFVIARMQGGRLGDWRIKLTSSGEAETNDLARLSQLAQKMHSEIGWWLPALVAERIVAGIDVTCISGPVLYRFARERTNPHNFNLLISTTGQQMQTSTFQRVAHPCR